MSRATTAGGAESIAANETLADYERVRRFDLLPTVFSVETEELYA